MTFDQVASMGLYGGGIGGAGIGYTITVTGFPGGEAGHAAMEAAVRLLAAHPETQP